MDLKINIKVSVTRLKKALNSARQKVNYYENELYNIRNICPHKNYISSTPWEESNYDHEGYLQTWSERLNTCEDCGHMWHQQTDRWGDFEGSGLE